MNRLIYAIDRLSKTVGHVFAWCIIILMLGTSYEVFVRYVLDDPTSWAFDFSYIMYGALFYMAGAYTLSRGGHVRADMFYRLWRPRTQAAVELVLYVVFFFPGVTALVLAGWKYSSRAWGYLEVSSNSPAGIPIFQFKSVIVAAGVLLFLQGIAQVFRCIICLRTGEWLGTSEDVEELEKVLLESQSLDALNEGTASGGRGGER